MEDMSRAILQVVIRGRVQGVGYRAWVESQAVAIGLEGWVRNRRDGDVEALFKGPAEVVASMTDACRHGPRGARVDDIVQRDGASTEMNVRRPGERFSVAPTA
jgi:acylphosphatase